MSVLAVAVSVRWVMSHRAHDDTPPSLSDAAATGSEAIRSGAFSFSMPGKPTVRSLDQTVAGIAMRGTIWVLGSGLEQLQVLTMQFPGDLTAQAAQGAYGGQVEGMRRRGNGTIVADQTFTWQGLPARRVEIDIAGARLYSTMFARGSWVLSVVASSASEAGPPAAYTRLIASIATNDSATIEPTATPPPVVK